MCDHDAVSATSSERSLRVRSLAPVLLGLAVGLSLAACSSSSPGSTVGTAPPTSAPAVTVPTPARSTTTTSATASPTPVPAPALKAPAVPTAGAYLGAWIHPEPAATPGPAFAVQERALPAVQAVTGRPLAILHVYSAWSRPAPVANLAAVAANGSIPLLDWGCAGNGAQVAGGADDAQITAYAQALKAFGRPVFLRWCWEMNLVKFHPQMGGPAGFTGAWVHIWTLFHRAGAANVSFVWCPAVSGADPTPYYPGDATVDWIGVDGYDRGGSGTFASVFSAFGQKWANHARPLMVAETGSVSPHQATYIKSIGTDMPTLPAFRAVVYFDAPGPARNWKLAAGGLEAFGALAQDPYFTPTTG